MHTRKKENISKNTRTLVIGDIHGRYDEILKAFEFAAYKNADRLIFLGDYIYSQGPDSKKVLNFVNYPNQSKIGLGLLGSTRGIDAPPLPKRLFGQFLPYLEY